MDTDLRCVFILVLFGLSLLLVSSDLRKGNYVHMGSSLPWTDAMENCKDVFNSSLLIIENEAQDSELENKEGWIALRLMDNSQWQWPGGRPLNYSRLTDHTDVNKKCVKRKNSEWKGEDCGHDKRFFCANNKLLLIKENKTWEQALEHCRGLLGINNTKKVVGYHLVSLGTPDDYLFASEMAQDATTAEVWTGLRFLAGRWFWADGGKPMIPTTLSLCPEQNNFCGALSLSSKSFETSNCMTKRNFLCLKMS